MRHNPRGKSRFLPFEEARQIIRESDIDTGAQYRKARREGLLPEGMPAAPNKKYENEGWVSWGDFLRGGSRFLPFEEARRIMRASDIETWSEYAKARREGLLPEGMPSAPDRAYASKGWISWIDFLRSGTRSRFLPFEEAREIMMASDINTRDEFNRASREGRLPEGIHSNPDRKYKNEGWISWGDFLRNGQKRSGRRARG